ncbi:unnamed protein product [Protopolystoma xenopodis]|uniref:Uncharacterized protein n=1 Tax=Protopolystoma xenopodis TaxID=117903 RepID=A0A448XL61_9PLAT|nr:unnamed protein product [Protopolystoma xenopodis]
MTVASAEGLEDIMQESDSRQQAPTSNDVALTHLEEVIAGVISEAVEYADKPPEERTLPPLIRKPNPPPRPRPSYNVVNNFGQVGVAGTVKNGALQVSQLNANLQAGLASNVAVQFANKSQTNQAVLMQFNALQGGSNIQSSPQQLMMQYNGIQTPQYSAQQQYSQAGQVQLQQSQQSQYQAASSAAFTHVQQLQHQTPAQLCPAMHARLGQIFVSMHLHWCLRPNASLRAFFVYTRCPNAHWPVRIICLQLELSLILSLCLPPTASHS